MLRILFLLGMSIFALGSQAAERLTYAGSSTIGKFVADATATYRDALFNVSTMAESAFGERCVQEGRCDLGGVAREVDLAGMQPGINKTLIGYDMLSVIVHKDNPVQELSLAQLKAIFMGQIDNWSQLGQADLPLKAYTVKPASATFQVFSDLVLDGGPYRSVEAVPFDAKMTSQVARSKGAIGVISAAFSRNVSSIRVVPVAGKLPQLGASDYPLSRPLYLLLPADSNPVARAFVDWAISDEGQRVVEKRFGGIR